MFNSNPNPQSIQPSNINTNELAKATVTSKPYNSEKIQPMEAKVKPKQSLSLGKELINVVTTNFTENGRENTTMAKINEREFFETQNKEVEYEKRYTSSNRVNISEHNEADNILSHIDKLKFIFKSKEVYIDKFTDHNQRQVLQLNQMLESVKPVNSLTNSETRKVNVINSNMLSNDFLTSPTMTISREVDCVEKSDKKETVNKEIFTNSDARIKRYGILFDFIKTNLEELNGVIYNRNHEVSRDLYKIDEENTNKLSSLHSKINLESRTNILAKDSVCDYEDSEMGEFTNMGPKVKNLIQLRQPGCAYNPINNFAGCDITKSLISSINSEFYHDLIEGSFRQSFLNLSNDMSSIRTINDRYRMERHFNDIDQTQYINRRSIVLNERYIEGEENIDSDLDRTKENIQVCNPNRLPIYNNMIRDIHKNKVIRGLIFRHPVSQAYRKSINPNRLKKYFNE
jgi:hypothetical protein